jgi:toxin ParE1/3/4
VTFRVRPEAETDLERIALTIEKISPRAAKRWLDDIHRHCQRLGDMPGMGVARPDVRPDLRLFPVGNYLILYREIDTGAEIVRVIHGARQWEDLI